MAAAWHRSGIAGLRGALERQTVSATALSQYFLTRIEALNHRGPALNAVREVSPRVAETAAALDGGKAHGPLWGIPVLLKDNILSADGTATTAGSLALADLRARRAATLVTRLEAAGAVILGKANLTEFADYLADVMPSEYSSAGGVVRHPWATADNPLRYDRGGGSSVGPACAVAAGLCTAAVGSETQNSIQSPAGDSGVVGLKPTVGLISRAGVVPLAMSQDTAGPLARSVADVAVLLGVLAGPDPGDSLTLAGGPHALADYTAGLHGLALRGARIGVPRAVYWGRPGQEQVEAVAEAAIATLGDAGAVIVDPAEVPTAGQLAALRSRVFPTEFKAGLNHLLASLSESPCASLAEIIAFNKAHPDNCLRYGQVLAENANGMPGLEDPGYRADRLRDITLSRELGIDAVLNRHDLDALVIPAGAAAKLTGKAGYPVLTVPAGIAGDGRPVGLSFIGPAWSEARLLALGHAFELARGALPESPAMAFAPEGDD